MWVVRELVGPSMGGGNLGSEEVGKSMGGGEGVAILCIVWSKVRKESQSKW